ncbi:protein IWS1 homolog isoform X2 [Coturnix japonica]|uniref:protein IWS1 homolog isoform X2 n=1 Tax=Coturnix japonica TaxID=93934 RepID=UPI0007777F12|nr:protein IWS1 homolog isoform X2 [Coturnix japonica]XP_015726499.1 protein IWS1 homolog isoform X2 [Coturnix japonica]XP_032302338.1 protein IWS1 homolog isoform X2 [Coturnix japonica]
MENEYYSGDQSDDGGATPVQDERDSGSDVEDEGNEQHSGSENGSVGHRSENEHSDGEDDGQMGEHHMTDSENEDVPRQKDSDSDNEEPPNHNGSDSDNEATHGGKDSDSDTEDRPNQHLSDSENEDALNHQASDSENGEPHRNHSSDFENEEPQKQPASDSENEELHKQPASDSESEELHKQLASDSESEGVARHKPEVESDDSDGEDRKEEVQNDSHHSDNEQAREGFQGSDSEEEGPQRRKISDSDDEEKEEEKTVKRKTAILSDSEDENEKAPAKKVRILSDVEESDSDAASEKSDKRKKNMVSDSEEEEERKEDTGKKKEEKDLFGSDSESGNEQENLIADIFGESGDEEEEEFTGFNQEDLEEEKGDAEMKETADESDSDDNVKRGKHMDFMSDFDMMLQRKKSMSGKRRRNRDGGTFISDADDVVSAMIVKMNEAAEEDRQLNTQKKPALKKLTLLPTVVMHLKKQDLKETFIDSGVMSAIKEWLSPLPDRSLPALKIREELLKILQELPSVSQETLKHSGIGRAVMYLYKHPKESRPNKDMAGKLINEWSRPIFGLTSNYKGMTREEREQRDLEQMPQRRRLSSSGGQTPRRDLEKVLTGEEKALRPGDPGFCARARVPMPSNKDYVVRPKWNVEMESSRPGTIRRGISRLEKHKRRFAEQKRLSKVHRAIKFSIEGNRMPL